MRRRGNRKLKKGAKPGAARTPTSPLETAKHIAGIVLAAAAVLSALALGSFERQAGNLAGPVGHRVAARLLTEVGLLSFFAPLSLAAVAVQLLGVVRWSRIAVVRSLFVAAATACSVIFGALLFPETQVLGATLGGQLAAALSVPLVGSLATVGGALATGALAWAFLSLATNHATSRAAGRAAGFIGGVVLRVAGKGLQRGWGWAVTVGEAAWREHLESWTQWKHGSDENTEHEEDALDPKALDEAVAEEAQKRGELLARGTMSAPAWLRDSEVEIEPAAPAIAAHPKPRANKPEVLTVGEDGRIRDAKQKPAVEPIALLSDMEVTPEPTSKKRPPPPPVEALNSLPGVATDPIPSAETAAPVATESPNPHVPAIVESIVPPPPKRKKKEKGSAFRLSKTGDGFTLPTLELLEVPPDIRTDIDRDALTETAHKLTAEARRLRYQGARRDHPPRASDHDVRVRAGARHPRLQDPVALRRPGDGDGGPAGSHRGAHPRQERRRHRGAQPAAQEGLPAGDPRGGRVQQDDLPADAGLRQGHRGRAVRRRSRRACRTCSSPARPARASRSR